MSSAPRLLYVVLFLQTQENGLWQDMRSFRRIQPHVFGILPLSPDSAPNFVPGGLVFIGQEKSCLDTCGLLLVLCSLFPVRALVSFLYLVGRARFGNSTSVPLSSNVHAKYRCQYFPQFKNVIALGSGGGRVRSPGVAQRPTGALHRVQNRTGCLTERASVRSARKKLSQL